MTNQQTYEVTDIPADEVDTVVRRYRSQNPNRIEEVKQDDGRYTVRAIFGTSKAYVPQTNP